MAYIPGAPTEAQSAIQQNMAQSGATVAGQQESAAATSVATPTATPQAPVMPTAGVGGVPSNIPTSPIAGSGGGTSIPAVAPSPALPTSTPSVPAAPAPAPAAPSIPTRTRNTIKDLPADAARLSGGNVYDANGNLLGTYTNMNSRGGSYTAYFTPAATPSVEPPAPVVAPVDQWPEILLPSPGTGGMPTAGIEATEAGGAAPGSSISPQDGSGGIPVTTPPPTTPTPPPILTSTPIDGPGEETPPEEEPPPVEETPPQETINLSDLFARAIGIQNETLETAAADKERALNSLADSLAQTEKDRQRAFDFDDDLEDLVGAATEEQEAALGRQGAYDEAIDRSVGTSAADYARLARDYAQGVANPEAAEVARRAVQQAVQAARASGINRGQAAIVGGQQGGNLFSQAYQDAVNRATEQYGQGAALLRTLAEDAAARRATAAGERAEGMGLRGNVQSLLAGLTGQDVNARLATQQLAGAEASQQAEIARQAANMATTKLSDQRAQEALDAASTANTWGAIGNLGKGLLELIPGVGDWLGGMLFPDKSAPAAPTGGATYGS